MILTTIFFSKSSPMFRPRYSCVGRAKQLWLMTPSDTKSPVPVVMSYSGRSRSSGSTDTTFKVVFDLNASPSIERFREMAGSTVWKKRRRSLRPPRTRMYAKPLSCLDISTA